MQDDKKNIERQKTSSYLQKEIQISKGETEHLKKMEELPQHLKQLYFPDVQFSDIKFQTFMLSELQGELIVNYNDAHCRSCMQEVDSIRPRLGKTDKKLLVLFDEKYRSEVGTVHRFNSDVMIGFVTVDTKELISMQQGYNLVYVLDQDHQISFFGRGDKPGLSKQAIEAQN